MTHREMLKLFFVAVVVAAVATDLDTEWNAFKAKHNKIYTTEVEAMRKSIWSENKMIIEEHNKKYRLGFSSFFMSENEYTDLTSSEFASQMIGVRIERKYVAENATSERNDPPLPATVDWRKKGYVTPVKKQGNCLSSWAFSATGSIEGQHFKAKGKLVSLSESNLVDCTYSNVTDGCNGGKTVDAISYVIDNKGIDTEATYPYTAKAGRCNFTRSNTGATLSNYLYLPPGSEYVMQQQVAVQGPVSVAIDANHTSFRHYGGGVYYEPACSTIILSHAVLVVGYGTDQGKDYWLVKNSWGTTWGDEGYIMMSRYKHNQCGIATDPIYPLV